MPDDSFNPYASPSAESAPLPRRRPRGATFLAIVSLILGVWLGGGGVLDFVRKWQEIGLPTQLHTYVRYAHLESIAIVAVIASAGLFFGRRWGWWFAITFFYLVLATFVLVPFVRFRFDNTIVMRMVLGTALWVGWLYLQRPHVRDYFAAAGDDRWFKHAALFAFTVAIVFSFVFI